MAIDSARRRSRLTALLGSSGLGSSQRSSLFRTNLLRGPALVEDDDEDDNEDDKRNANTKTNAKAKSQRVVLARAGRGSGGGRGAGDPRDAIGSSKGTGGDGVLGSSRKGACFSKNEGLSQACRNRNCLGGTDTVGGLEERSAARGSSSAERSEDHANLTSGDRESIGVEEGLSSQHVEIENKVGIGSQASVLQCHADRVGHSHGGHLGHSPLSSVNGLGRREGGGRLGGGGLGTRGRGLANDTQREALVNKLHLTATSKGNGDSAAVSIRASSIESRWESLLGVSVLGDPNIASCVGSSDCGDCDSLG